MEQSNEKYQQKSTSKLGIRHLQSLLMFLFVAITYGMRTSLSVAIVAMTDNTSSNSDIPVYDWDSNKRSLIMSSLMWGALISQIPIGYLTRNGGSHKVCCISFIVSGVATLLIPVLASSGGWIAVICIRVILGLSQGSITPCSYKIMSEWAPPQERARLVSFVINGAQLGTIIFMPIAGVLAKSMFGWPSIFYASGLMCLVWTILFYFLGTDTPAEHPKISPAELQYIESSLGKSNNDEEDVNVKVPWRAMITSIPVWAVVISNLSQSWCYYIYVNELPSYMTYILKFDIQQSGLVSAIPYLVMWLAGFPFSWLSDFALHKGVSITCLRKICNTIAMWGPGLLLLIMAFIKTDSKTVYVLLLTLTMGLNAAITAGSEIVAIDLTTTFSGTLIAFTNSAAKIAAMLSPIVCGLIITDQTNEAQWKTVFYSAAGIYFFANLIFVIFGSAKKQPWDYQGSEKGITVKTPRVSMISSIY